MVYADLARSRDSRMFRDLVMKPSSFSPPVIPARHRVTRLNEGSTRSAWKRRNRARGSFCLAIYRSIPGLVISYDGSFMFLRYRIPLPLVEKGMLIERSVSLERNICCESVERR